MNQALLNITPQSVLASTPNPILNLPRRSSGASWAASASAATLLSIASLAPFTASADTIFGVYAGAQFWNNQFDGDFGNVGDTPIDVEEALGLDSESSTSLYAAVEHPVPLLPNAKLRSTQIEYNESHDLVGSITFQGITFSDTSIVSDIDLSHLDGTLYYELLDNWVNLDLGITARRYDGHFEITADPGSASADIDETIVMIYGAAQIDLPFTGFYARAEGNGLAIDDHNHTDFMAVIGYESDLRFGAELGYRIMTLELEELDVGAFEVDTDLTVDGFFLGLTLHI